MALNDSNIIIVQHSGTYSDGAGDDIYLLSGLGLSAVDANAQILINDGAGENKIFLEGGLSISSSTVFADALQLTLSNNAVVQVLASSNFTFYTGGSLTSPGDNSSYADMVSSVLGVSVPTGSASVTGGAVTMGDTTTPTVVGVATINVNTNDPAKGTTASDSFSFSPTSASKDSDESYTITGFDPENDKLLINFNTVPTGIFDSLDDLAGQDNDALGPISVAANPFTGDMVAIFGNDAATGKPIQLTIEGINVASTIKIELVGGTVSSSLPIIDLI